MPFSSQGKRAQIFLNIVGLRILSHGALAGVSDKKWPVERGNPRRCCGDCDCDAGLSSCLNRHMPLALPVGLALLHVFYSIGQTLLRGLSVKNSDASHLCCVRTLSHTHTSTWQVANDF